jgi:hypothetical protein
MTSSTKKSIRQRRRPTTISKELRKFWNDLVALNVRFRNIQDDRPILETREFLDSHSHLWEQIKTCMAAYPDDKWMSWEIACAFCDATGQQQVEHYHRVWVLGDAECNGRKNPPW